MLPSPSLMVPYTHFTWAAMIFFCVQDYSMHNADDYTILHLLLIKNKYVALPLFAPSKILTTISYLQKKYNPRNQEAASVTSSSDRLLIENVIQCCRVTGQLANGNLNFKRNMNKILFYFENELSALHHESNICLNLLCSWSLRLLAESFDFWT